MDCTFNVFKYVENKFEVVKHQSKNLSRRYWKSIKLLHFASQVRLGNQTEKSTCFHYAFKYVENKIASENSEGKYEQKVLKV